MFSGAFLRSILCFLGLSVMALHNVRYFRKILSNPSKSMAVGLDTKNLSLSKPINEYSLNTKNWSVLGIFILGMLVILYGVFYLNWHIVELSAIFLMIALGCGLVSKWMQQPSCTVWKPFHRHRSIHGRICHNHKVLMEMKY